MVLKELSSYESTLFLEIICVAFLTCSVLISMNLLKCTITKDSNMDLLEDLQFNFYLLLDI